MTLYNFCGRISWTIVEFILITLLKEVEHGIKGDNNEDLSYNIYKLTQCCDK